MFVAESDRKKVDKTKMENKGVKCVQTEKIIGNKGAWGVNIDISREGKTIQLANVELPNVELLNVKLPNCRITGRRITEGRKLPDVEFANVESSQEKYPLK
jgi:hypothetical protein